MKKKFSLKDHLFNREKVNYLGELFHAADDSFDVKHFVAEVMETLTDLELKQRIVLIAEVLEKYLDSDFKKATGQIVSALPEELDQNKTDDDFGDFIMAPLGEFVVRNGLDKKDLKISLKTLKEITKRFSMEDAIRYFINAFPKETMTELGRWAKDQNYHVRRLVSEGTRPLLPWSGRIDLSVEEPLPLLDMLHADTTRYVTRSVANHMNDMSKANPKIVIQTLKRWQKEKKQVQKELDWITNHSLRTLVKQGNKEALILLGYHDKPEITVSDLILNTQEIKAGDVLHFSFDITADADEKLLIDYVIDFVKANGATAPKVFKLKKTEIKKGKTTVFEKKHRFVKDATTFTLYPGKHQLTLQINGKQYMSAFFEIQKT